MGGPRPGGDRRAGPEPDGGGISGGGRSERVIPFRRRPRPGRRGTAGHAGGGLDGRLVDPRRRWRHLPARRRAELHLQWHHRHRPQRDPGLVTVDRLHRMGGRRSDHRRRDQPVVPGLGLDGRPRRQLPDVHQRRLGKSQRHLRGTRSVHRRRPGGGVPPTATQVAQGYLRCGLALADGDGNVALVALDYATAAAPPPPSSTAVGMAATPDGGGYWLAWSNGNITVHGDAQSYGNASQLSLNQPITHVVATPDGKGYWLVAADGGTFAFGDAGFYGSMGGQHLNEPVVDMAPTNDGRGYWLVASDGGIFAFGDAAFDGSMGGQPLNKPVVGMSADPVTGGYWLVASDGGIFSFGAPFFGSTGALHLNQPVNGMATTTDGQGYWFVASDGGIFAFGDAGFHGSMGGSSLAAPIVGDGHRQRHRRVLAGGLGWWHLQLRRTVLRFRLTDLPERHRRNTGRGAAGLPVRVSGHGPSTGRQDRAGHRGVPGDRPGHRPGLRRRRGIGDALVPQGRRPGRGRGRDRRGQRATGPARWPGTWPTPAIPSRPRRAWPPPSSGSARWTSWSTTPPPTPTTARSSSSTPPRADKTVRVNQTGYLEWAQCAWRAGMSERGGVVLNLASIGGLSVEGGIGWYNVTKAAVIHLTSQLAGELGPDGPGQRPGPGPGQDRVRPGPVGAGGGGHRPAPAPAPAGRARGHRQRRPVPVLGRRLVDHRAHPGHRRRCPVHGQRRAVLSREDPVSSDPPMGPRVSQVRPGGPCRSASGGGEPTTTS